MRSNTTKGRARLNVLAFAFAAAALTLLFAGAPAAVQAAEIKSLTAVAFEIVLREIGSEFERATGHKINMTIDLAPQPADLFRHDYHACGLADA